MAIAQVSALRSIEFGVPDLAASAAFYTAVWGLAPVHQDSETAYLRATGAEHHVVVLRRKRGPSFLRVNLAAPDRDAVAALHRQVIEAGATPLGPPAELAEPGAGYGFAFRDTEGREFRILSDVATHADASDAPTGDRPFKLAHVVMNAAVTDATSEFFRRTLGFRTTDQTAMMEFIRCNADHHSLAFARNGNVSLNHVAFEMPSWDALMRGCGRMKESGFGIEWGLGRHGPGNNVFAYFVEPNDFAIEYTAEVQQIDEATHVVGTPAQWKRPANRLDQWGFSDPPSKRIAAIMHGDHPPAGPHAPVHAAPGS